VAGTDPTSPTALLRITSVDRDGDNVRVGWTARGGKTYRIIEAGDLRVGFTPLATTNAVGGSAPWYVVTSYYTDPTSSATNQRFYRIETGP
jgi:hypothetical protein